MKRVGFGWIVLPFVIVPLRASTPSAKMTGPEDPCSLGGWAALRPERFKEVGQVSLSVNPFQSVSFHSESMIPDIFTEGALAKANQGLGELIRGVYPGGTNACVLVGSRLLHIGQELKLSDYSWAGRLTGRIRLRQVSPERVVFVCDEKLRKQLGVEEWVIDLSNRESHP